MKHKCKNCAYQNWKGAQTGGECYVPVKSKVNKWTGVTSETNYIEGIFPENNNNSGECIYFKSSISIWSYIFVISVMVLIYCGAILLTWKFLQEIGVL